MNIVDFSMTSDRGSTNLNLTFSLQKNPLKRREMMRYYLMRYYLMSVAFFLIESHSTNEYNDMKESAKDYLWAVMPRTEDDGWRKNWDGIKYSYFYISYIITSQWFMHKRELSMEIRTSTIRHKQGRPGQ